MNYNLLFEERQHYISIPQRHSRILCRDESHLLKILKNQRPGEDIFISKYAEDGFVKTIILDFDNKDNPKKAFADAKRLQKETMKHGLNTVIVKSGSKGYHTYTQIPPHAFGNNPSIDEIGAGICFDKFVELVINERKYHYRTLDNTNTHAGLRGNIRLIGSIHPKTNSLCEIIDGSFKDMDTEENPYSLESYSHIHKCFLNAMNSTITSTEIKEKELLKKLRTLKKDGVTHSAPEHDLRTLMPQIYGGNTKSYAKGYIMMQCPFHNDNNPSMKVKKEFYYCLGCGATGNWWTLRELGVVDFDYIRVGKNKNKVRT